MKDEKYGVSELGVVEKLKGNGGSRKQVREGRGLDPFLAGLDWFDVWVFMENIESRVVILWFGVF